MVRECISSPTASGRFTEEDTVGDLQGKTLIMLAAGTGLAPFLSIVKSKVRQDPNCRLDNYVMIHGASNPTYLGYMDELNALARNNGLKYLPTISRPKEAPGWKGCTGRAESVLQPDRYAETEKRLGIELRPDKTLITICGLTGTISQTIKGLAERGYIPHHRKLRKELGIADDIPSSIYYEQYDSEPVIDLKDTALVEKIKGQIQDGLSKL